MVEKEGEKASSSVKAKDNKKAKAISKKEILDDIIKKIDYYTSKNAVNDVDLYYLIKEFFKEFLDLNYEFSLDELLMELDKIYLDNSTRDHAVEFIEKVMIIEYADNSFSSEYIRELLREFSLLSRSLAKITNPEKPSFWKKLSTMFSAKKEQNDKPLQKKEVSAEKSSVLDLAGGYSGKNLEVKAEASYSGKEAAPEQPQTPASAAPNELPADKKPEELKPETISKDYTGALADYKKYYSSGADVSKTASTEAANKIISSDELSETAESDNKNKENRKASAQKKNTAIQKKDDFTKLLEKAKKSSKKSELTNLYKQIHERYDAADTDFQAKYYKDIMSLYNKITKLK
ncbi:MAG: hypothetical protein ACP5N3_06590 [Candidatus Nanoarchaeia archaeon]